MTGTTATDVATITRITRTTDAEEVATAAYAQHLDLLSRLAPDDWNATTDCPAWDVADTVRHVLGAARGHAGRRELVRQLVHGARHRSAHGDNALDATNALQVADHADLDPDQLVEQLHAWAPRAVRGRMRTPAPLRAVRIPIDAGGSTAPGMPSRLRLGHLMDAVLTRDVWLHTLDVERATGVEADRSGPLDGRIVEDVVAEWASRHGRPFRLRLTGPGARHVQHGTSGPELVLDAREFCRVLSGRADAPHELLSVRVLF